MLKFCLFMWNNDLQVPPHTVAGYATVAATTEGDIKRLVGVIWQVFDCKTGYCFFCITIALMGLIVVLILLAFFRSHVSYNFESLTVHDFCHLYYKYRYIIRLEGENTREDKVSSKIKVIMNIRYKLVVNLNTTTQGENAKLNHPQLP